jgi:hypothetical protein
VYVDTGAFIALLWRRDRQHDRCRRHYLSVRDAHDVLLTSNHVVAETATRLRYDAGLRLALQFRELVDEAVEVGRLVVRHADAQLESRAWDTMAQYADVTLSFADCVGAVTARDGGAHAIFGLDTDFRALGFSVEPAA